MKNNEINDGYVLDSEVIKVLRFPLAVMVVFLHAEPYIQGWNITSMTVGHMGLNITGVIMYSISHILTQIAVPAFFVISGYLFFKKLEIWNCKEWERKIRSRIYSLIVPYLIWVSIFCLIHILRHIIPGHDVLEMPDIIMSWIREQGGFLNLYWSSSVWLAGATNVFGQPLLMSGPMPFHLWFLRDLIVAVLISPLFYMLYHKGIGKKKRLVAIFSFFLIAILYLFQIQIPIHGISFTTLFYFGTGAFLSMNGISISNCVYKYRWLIGCIAAVLFVILIPMDGSRTTNGVMLFPLWTITGVITAFNIAVAYVKIKGGEGYSLISNSSFFLYMIHPFVLAMVGMILTVAACKLFHVDSISDVAFVDVYPIFTLLLFFVKVLVSIVISVIVYNILVYICPWFARVICGR
ncbi:acyltransferase [Bacteroides acidifaciens]|uniref:acyltransferase n=1 Tax=Bacteroides acidifaciens TaxID=85831 RepID=UPI003015226A